MTLPRCLPKTRVRTVGRNRAVGRRPGDTARVAHLLTLPYETVLASCTALLAGEAGEYATMGDREFWEAFREFFRGGRWVAGDEAA